MKSIIVADPHIGAHKNDKIWIKQAEFLFDQIHDTCTRENIKQVIVVGDWFDSRLSVDVSTLCTSYEILSKLSDLDIILLLGNHDQYYKNLPYPNSLTVFESLPHVRLISEPTEIENVIFLPWSLQKYDLTQYNKPFVIGHFDISDFFVADEDSKKNRYKKEEFEKFMFVITGHFHTPSQKGNIMYCGAPYHLSFSEEGAKMGYYIFDDQADNFVRFIENERYAKYIRISTEDALEPTMIEGNIVRLIYSKDYGTQGNNEKLEKVQSLHPLKLDTDFSNISINTEDENEETSENSVMESINTKEIFVNYIKTITLPEHLEYNTLIHVIDNIME